MAPRASLQLCLQLFSSEDLVIKKIKQQSKTPPHRRRRKREACFTKELFQNHDFFKKLHRMWNGVGKNVSCGLRRPCSCSSLKLLFTPSGLVSSRKFFKQNSAFNPLSSCSRPLGPPIRSGSLP